MRTYIIALFFMQYFTSGCKESISKRIIRPESFSGNHWRVYSDIDSIPTAIVKKLEEIGHVSFTIANPNAPYQATDMIDDPQLPSRRLSFLGQSNGLWLLIYKHGGIGNHTHVVICQMQGDNVDVCRTGGLIHSSSDEIKNVQEFRKELINENVLFNRNTSEEEIEL